MPKNQIAAQRLYLTADQQALVPAGHKDAATLYANEGTLIPESACEMFGLKDGKLPGGKKANAKTGTKAAPPPPNKEGRTPPNKGGKPGQTKPKPAGGDKSAAGAKAPELTDIDGIGPATAKKLVDAGIAGVAGLAAVDLAKRPEIEGLPPAFDWGSSIAAAKKLVPDEGAADSGSDEEE